MLKGLHRPTKKKLIVHKTEVATPVPHQAEEKIQKFIAQERALAKGFAEARDDHRITLRLPKWLFAKIDAKRKERIGVVSRNLWILEQINKAVQEEN